MKLTKDNIDFIDRYLLNSGVEYKDIRLEMTDHVATALETDMETNPNFREAFKAYMVKHKAGLLNDFKTFKKQAFNGFVKHWAKVFLKPCSLVLFAVLFGVFWNTWGTVMPFLASNTIKLWIMGFMLAAAAYWLLIRKVFLKERYSAIEASGFWIVMILYFFNTLLTSFSGWLLTSNFKPVGVATAVIMVLMLVHFFSTVRFYIHFYKNKYVL